MVGCITSIDTLPSAAVLVLVLVLVRVVCDAAAAAAAIALFRMMAWYLCGGERRVPLT
jgi:hypothetical protein